VLNALERLIGGYAPECASIRRELQIAENQLRDYQARLGQPFAHEEYLARLTALRDQLKAGLASPQPTGESGLSGATPEPGSDAPPSVSELAEQIKALKAAHTIEATPERAVRRRVAAEEPVTTRIRRRADPVPAAAPDIEAEGAAAPAEPTPEADSAPPAQAEQPTPSPAHQTGLNGDNPGQHEPTFRERMAKSPRHRERQLTMF
jgi:hypothetical protein